MEPELPVEPRDEWDCVHLAAMRHFKRGISHGLDGLCRSGEPEGQTRRSLVFRGTRTPVEALFENLLGGAPSISSQCGFQG